MDGQNVRARRTKYTLVPRATYREDAERVERVFRAILQGRLERLRAMEGKQAKEEP